MQTARTGISMLITSPVFFNASQVAFINDLILYYLLKRNDYF